MSNQATAAMTASDAVVEGDGASRRSLCGSLGATVMSIARASSEEKRIQRDAVVAFLVRATSAALLYLTQIILARWMGVFEYGVYVLIWTAVVITGGLVHLGLSLTMMRLLPAYLERRERALYRGLVSSGRWFALSSGAAVAAVVYALLTHLEGTVASPYLAPACLIVFAIPLYALTDIQDGIGRARGWMAVGLMPPYVLRPLVLLAVMTGAHAAGLPMTAMAAATAAILACLVAVLLQSWLVRERVREEVGEGPRSYRLGFWIRGSLPLLAMLVAELVMQNADVLAVSAHMSPVEVGMYFAAAKTMALVMFIHYAVGSAAGKRFATLNARSNSDELGKFVRQAVRWTFWPSLVAAVVILALGRPMLWLFSPSYVEAYPLMFILAIGYLFRAAMGPAEFLLNALGEQRACAKVVGFAAMGNIGLCLTLVPLFGLYGAAMSTAVSLALSATLNGIVARRRLGQDVTILGTLRRRGA